MTELITGDLVRLDADLGSDKDAVIRSLAEVVGAAGRTSDVDQLVADAMAREGQSPTGLPGGIAIPHCRTAAVAEPTLAFARLSPGIDFGAKDGPADLAFLITAPAGGDSTHLTLLTQLARALVKRDFTNALREAQSPQEVVDLVLGVVKLEDKAPAAAPAPAATAPASTGAVAATSAAAPAAGGSDAKPSLVAVTACPTGIAHTYMAAEALEAAAERAGVEIQVETQGSAGSTPLDPSVIQRAAAVIFAVDVGVRDRGRFAGKPLVASGVKRPIDEGDEMIAEALEFARNPERSPRVEGDAAAAGASSGVTETGGARVRRVLMTGVSYMIPFVAAGGLLLALGFLLAGDEIANVSGNIAVNYTIFNLPNPSDVGLPHAPFNSGLLAYLGSLCFVIGGTAFKLFIPAFAGYIAYAIADRPGIAPGFVMGGIAINLANVANSADTPVSLPATGFIGAIIGGVLAGVIALWIGRWRVPTWMRGLMPVLIIPLLTSLVAGLVMVIVLGKPIAALMSALNDGLTNMAGSPGLATLLGVIIGLMMAFDMGGPLNKVAYAFGVSGLTAAAVESGNAPQLTIMAAVMLAGMVPPLALALATAVRPRLFTPAERENGKAAWLLGASFITEGAIPFAAADPLRVIPSIMLGSAVTGGLCELLDVTLVAPHGGIFVLFFAVGNVGGFLISLVAGVLVAAAAVVALKSVAKTELAEVAPVA